MGRKYEIAVLSRGAYARTLRIYSPKKADRAIIMHDGQNVYYDSDATFKKSWRALDILKSLRIKNTAIIGIDSTATREDDYLPFPSEITEPKQKTAGGKADVYADFIEKTVIPYLENRFGYKKYGMLGSSAGALITMYYAATREPKMSAYGMFSIPLFISAAAYKKFLGTARFPADAYYNVYTGGSEVVGSGKEAELSTDLFVSDSFTLVTALRASGAKNVTLSVNGLGIHDEISWRASEAEYFKTFSKL